MNPSVDKGSMASWCHFGTVQPFRAVSASKANILESRCLESRTVRVAEPKGCKLSCGGVNSKGKPNYLLHDLKGCCTEMVESCPGFL
jgi:hypothetical protein